MLLIQSLTPSSQQVYRQAALKLAYFHRLLYNCDNFFPASVVTISLFIPHLVNLGFSPATIQTYVTAISFFNKCLGAHDLLSSFVIRKLLTAVQRNTQPASQRSPITLSTLYSLVLSTKVSLPPYKAALFSAAYLITFHAFLRIGEITCRSKKQSSTVLQFQDCTLVPSTLGACSLQITLRHFKGNTGCQPFSIVIPSSPDPRFCPVSHFQNFTALRGSTPGPLMVWQDGSPLSRSSFSKQLQATLSHANIHTPNIKAHSFRIGAATTACALGFSDQDIQKMGRWKSDAFKRYIRIPTFHTPQYMPHPYLNS